MGRHPRVINTQLLDLFRTEDMTSIVRQIAGGVVSHVVLPHVLFSFLARRYPEAFRMHLGADVNKTLPFWTKFLATSYGQHRFPGRVPTDMQYCLPLVVHGDAVPVTRRLSALFAQWGSLLGGPLVCSEVLDIDRIVPPRPPGEEEP